MILITNVFMHNIKFMFRIIFTIKTSFFPSICKPVVFNIKLRTPISKHLQNTYSPHSLYNIYIFLFTKAIVFIVDEVKKSFNNNISQTDNVSLTHMFQYNDFIKAMWPHIFDFMPQTLLLFYVNLPQSETQAFYNLHF